MVKTGGDLSSSKLRGAIAPEEILSSTSPNCNTFLECDPKDGFSVRNFQIQACKIAMVSDIVVYGDDNTPLNDTIALAKSISRAQRKYEVKNGLPRCLFNTFMLSGKPCVYLYCLDNTLMNIDTFSHVQVHQPDLIAIDASGTMTGNVADFCKLVHLLGNKASKLTLSQVTGNAMRCV